MNPNTVILIEPNPSSKRVLKCCVCAMAYAQEDYEVLKEARKLSYFDYSFRDETKTASVSPVCHFCLKEVVLKHNDGKETSVVIQAKGGETFNCTFYENDKN